MMLNENSGRPPPTNSSRPGTPVESLLIFTLSWILTHFSHVPNFERQNFRLATHCVEGLTSKLRQERCEVVRGSGRRERFLPRQPDPSQRRFEIQTLPGPVKIHPLRPAPPKDPELPTWLASRRGKRGTQKQLLPQMY